MPNPYDDNESINLSLTAMGARGRGPNGFGYWYLSWRMVPGT